MTQSKIASDCTLFLWSVTVEIQEFQDAVQQLQSGIELRKSIREEGLWTISEALDRRNPQILGDYNSFLESMALAANKIDEGLLQFRSKMDAITAVQKTGEDNGEESLKRRLKQFRLDYVTLLEVLNSAGGKYQEWERQLMSLRNGIREWRVHVEGTVVPFNSAMVASRMLMAITELIDCLRGDLCPLIRCEYSTLLEEVVDDDTSLQQIWDLILADDVFVFLGKVIESIFQLKRGLLQLQFPFAEEKMKRQASV